MLYLLSNSCIYRAHFKCIIGYSGRDFSPHYATAFSMKLCQKLFIECFSAVRAVPELLKEEEGLGAHTGVIMLLPSIGVQYFWCHDSIRPCGEQFPLQCPECLAIRTLRFSKTKDPWRFAARCICGWRMEHNTGKINVKFPESGKGWGSEMLYGSEQDLEVLRKAPREGSV
jgi:hypothetical protein